MQFVVLKGTVKITQKAHNDFLDALERAIWPLHKAFRLHRHDSRYKMLTFETVPMAERAEEVFMEALTFAKDTQSIDIVDRIADNLSQSGRYYLKMGGHVLVPVKIDLPDKNFFTNVPARLIPPELRVGR